MAGVTTYTEEIANKILDRIASEPTSLKVICKEEGMPSASTVYKWLVENKSFSDKYARAKIDQAEILADEIIDIADDSSGDDEIRYTAEGEPYRVENKEWVNRSKIRIDARKWKLSKLLPKKYGDRQIVDMSLKLGKDAEKEQEAFE